MIEDYPHSSSELNNIRDRVYQLVQTYNMHEGLVRFAFVIANEFNDYDRKEEFKQLLIKLD